MPNTKSAIRRTKRTQTQALVNKIRKSKYKSTIKKMSIYLSAGKIKEAKSHLGNGVPIVILMKTEMGNGVDFMMHTHAWHGKAPNDEQLEIALSQNSETLGDY